MKHAYLILAHNNWEILERLLMLLDDERNDIYLHIDKKVIFPDVKNRVKKSNLYVVARKNIRWGDISLVEAEYILFETAYRRGGYSYYHLLSGVDLPLKSQDYIHSFFDAHFPIEFIGFAQVPGFEDRVNKIHLFHRYQRTSNRYVNFLFKTLREFFILLQKIAGYNFYKSSAQLKMGPEWVSLTYHAVELILSKKEEVMRLYRRASCSDEVYKQTIIGNSFLYERVYDGKDDYKSCMRLIDWSRGNPYVFRNEDFESLISSDRLFARKFDYTRDPLIVERLVNFLTTPEPRQKGKEE